MSREIETECGLCLADSGVRVKWRRGGVRNPSTLSWRLALRWVFPGCVSREVHRVAFLEIATVSFVGQVQANVGMERIRFGSACLHGSSVCRRVIYGEDRPTLEVSATTATIMASRDREPGHFVALRVVHAVDGDFVIPEAHEEYFRNRPWLSCPLRRRLGEHASTEVLAFGQRRQAPRQETARGAILPVHAGGLATSPRVAARHRRDADARSSLPGTSSTLRLLRCRARSAVPPGRSLT